MFLPLLLIPHNSSHKLTRNEEAIDNTTGGRWIWEIKVIILLCHYRQKQIYCFEAQCHIHMELFVEIFL